MRIAVTGGSGRLGRHVCEELVRRGHEVRSGDRNFYKIDSVECRLLQFTDRFRVYEFLEGVEAVVHLANYPNHHSAPADIVAGENSVVNATVFQACRDLGIKKVLFASSIQVISGYQDDGRNDLLPTYLPLDGNHPARTRNVYSWSKRAGELLLEMHCEAAGWSAAAVRYPFLASRRWAHWLLKDPDRRGAVSEVFAFLPVTDAARFTAMAIEGLQPGFRLYLPAAATNTAALSVGELISRFYSSVPLRRPISEMECLVDLSAPREDFGWTPRCIYEELGVPREEHVALV